MSCKTIGMGLLKWEYLSEEINAFSGTLHEKKGSVKASEYTVFNVWQVL